MNYQHIYNQIIQKRQNNKLTKLKRSDSQYQYYESHHILPRSLGGTDDSSNIINLTAREHYICHRLLVKICEARFGKYSKEHCSMMYALNLMTFENKGHVHICSRQYDKMRSYFSEMQHIRMSGEGNPMYGRSIKDCMTEEEYERWVNKHSGKNHQFYGKKRPEHSKKMSGEGNPMYGRSIKDCMTEEEYERWHNKVKNNKNGKQNPFYGKHHSKETIERIRNANRRYKEIHGHGSNYGIKHTEEQRRHNSEMHKHPYSHDRKIRQNKTVITKICGDICDLSEFDFELYISLKPGDKVKYRKQYIKSHPKA